MAPPRSLAAVVAALEAWVPPSLAASWDEVGLRWGDPAAVVSGVLVAIDLTAAVLAEAERRGANLLIAYHPPMWRREARLPVAPLAQRAMAAGVAVYSPHTAWDAALGGTGCQLAAALGLTAVRPLCPHRAAAPAELAFTCPPSSVEAVVRAVAAAGAGELGAYTHCSFRTAGDGTFLPGPGARPHIGEVGALAREAEVHVEMRVAEGRLAAVVAALSAHHPYETPAFVLRPALGVPSPRQGMGRLGETDATLGELVAAAKAYAGVPHALLSLPPGAHLGARPGLVAVAAGAAGDMWRQAREAGAGLLVTGEVRHHDALAARAAGLAQVALLHSHSERPSLAALTRRLGAEPLLAGVEVAVSAADVDPQTIV